MEKYIHLGIQFFVAKACYIYNTVVIIIISIIPIDVYYTVIDHTEKN